MMTGVNSAHVFKYSVEVVSTLGGQLPYANCVVYCLPLLAANYDCPRHRHHTRGGSVNYRASGADITST